jgi:exosortase H (IPTLxxWG-CTERM-specific)
MSALQEANAAMSAAVLNVFGEGASADGTSLRSKRNSVNIAHGCDAIEPIALFVAAVIAFPSPWLTKLPGLLIGTLMLTALNIVRIVSLFYIGIWNPAWFDRMHEDVWQPAFIVLALFFWVVWALWATKPAVRRPANSPTPPQPPPTGPRDAHALA